MKLPQQCPKCKAARAWKIHGDEHGRGMDMACMMCGYVWYATPPMPLHEARYEVETRTAGKFG